MRSCKRQESLIYRLVKGLDSRSGLDSETKPSTSTFLLLRSPIAFHPRKVRPNNIWVGLISASPSHFFYRASNSYPIYVTLFCCQLFSTRHFPGNLGEKNKPTRKQFHDTQIQVHCLMRICADFFLKQASEYTTSSQTPHFWMMVSSRHFCFLIISYIKGNVRDNCLKCKQH